MGLKKIVMLTFWVGFVAGCTPLHPSDCHKTTATGSCSSGRWDKAYCEAIKSAAHKAKFPAFNNPEVYRDFQKSGFDMRG